MNYEPIEIPVYFNELTPIEILHLHLIFDLLLFI